MSTIDEKENVMQEEPLMTPPDSVGEQNLATGEENPGVQKNEDQETIDAIKKFTDENDMGEISIKSILGGDFLMSKLVMKQVLFVMFCVALTIVYTGNRYDSQQDAILIDSLRSHLQDVKYNVLTQSSELMNLTRQSSVEKVLKGTKDSILQNPITPPYLIRVSGKQSVAAERALKEVLVDSASLDTAKTEDDEI
ncbi:MAG: hypothetical protein KBT29_01365 [Prevotellaceae bacterium]|nr:hypothetical protein [Candidatus Minthosoma caballi]